MDGTAYIVLLLLCSASAMPMIEETNEEPAPETTAADVVTTPESITTTTTITEIPQEVSNCTTPRNLPGRCVQRVSCEYSTDAIDRTLYASRQYVKTCKIEEVCCPLKYVVEPPENQGAQRIYNNSDDAFEFDDDD